MFTRQGARPFFSSHKSIKIIMAKGGSFYKDLTDLAVPFGLLLAAHGVGAIANKAEKKKGGAKAQEKGGAAAKAKGAKANGGAKAKASRAKAK